MALIIPVGFGHAVYSMRLEGDTEPMVTTMGHDLSEVVGGDYQTIAERLFAQFATMASDLMSQPYSIEACTLYVGQDGGPPAIYESTGDPVPALGTATPLPQNCAYLIRKRTSAAGRRGRGRMYLPGIPEEQVNPAGVIGETWRAGRQTVVQTWLDGLNGTTGGFVPYPPVILHRSEGIGEEPPPTPVTALQVETSIATQRRRLRP